MAVVAAILVAGAATPPAPVNYQGVLRDYTALAHLKGGEAALHGKKPRDFSRADELRAAVGVFEPMKADAALGESTVLGRAIEPLRTGTGLIRVLTGAR
jgi:hypothetical protein